MGSMKNESGEIKGKKGKVEEGRKGEKEHGHVTQLKEKERKMGKRGREAKVLTA